MRITEGVLLRSPTDVTKFAACTHLTALDLQVARGELRNPSAEPDESLELLFRKGIEHEERYLASQRATQQVVEIEGPTISEKATATERAMQSGVAIIYQAAFLADGHQGYADFLVRADRPSNLGAWSYDVADTKLARRLKVPALLQMAEYGEHLLRIQGTAPRWLTVIAGDGEHYRYPFRDVVAYYRRISRRLDVFVAEPPTTTAEPVNHCGQCRWHSRCAGGWRAADHLSLVALMRSDHREQLEEAGILTVAALAAMNADELPRSIGRSSRSRLAQQARLQMRERRSGVPTYELLTPEPGRGLQGLPAPHAADLYLDFEGDPYVEPSGREYLAGVGTREGAFRAFWAHSVEEECRLTFDLVDMLSEERAKTPGSHVYHYAPYEVSALKRLTSRHGVREAELDVMLRQGFFVDLYAVVRQGVRISKESYSIKKLEAFYWGHTRTEGDVADAMSSVVAYERWLVQRDDAELEKICKYNQDDVNSTLALHDWLETLRAELESVNGVVLDRLTGSDPGSAAEPKERELKELALADDLVAAGHTLLAGLVGWHRREQRPGWWDVYRLAYMEDDDLVDDGAAIGELGPPIYVRDVNRSHVHRYEFPPQDTKIRLGRQALDIDSHNNVGEVVGLDPTAGWIETRIGKTKVPSSPRGLGPEGPIDDKVQRAAIASIARSVLEGQNSLGARLIDRVVPAALPVRADEKPSEAVVRIGSALDGSVLAVQGPPGTGKSTAGSKLIVALLNAGLRVGVTALSHQVIGNLLKKVGRPALQKCEADDHCGADFVVRTSDNAEVVAGLANGSHRLVGGTAWLWSRPDLAASIDVLVIDEAGQFSLANAVAVSQSATSLVLLGDPQQLSQPSQAQHPYGAGVSALEHILDGHPTVPTDRGVFLDTTWRMHPAITEFISMTSYEDRLHSGPGLERQRVIGAGSCIGSGLRWVPVDHVGNESASTEEAEVVRRLVNDLLGSAWIDQQHCEHQLTPDQILVVTPYNAQVARLRVAVNTAVQVGTVDKFQGREAAVVIYSLASSSATDAPRGVTFLYDVHRLNVAVSRARSLSVIVSSPKLLDSEVRGPGQLRLVNALCRYVELSRLPVS